MSVWSTKSSARDCNYIVLKHTLRGVNYVVNGIRFRNSYAVVEKDSKTHRNLKNIPVLKGCQEFPLIFLKKLPFITRPLDIKMVYGMDVYVKYLKELEIDKVKEHQEQKVKEEVIHVVEKKLCANRTLISNGQDLCTREALEQSPSGYCIRHILNDPKLQELGIEVPKFIDKKKKQQEREKVAEQLAKLKKEGKF